MDSQEKRERERGLSDGGSGRGGQQCGRGQRYTGLWARAGAKGPWGEGYSRRGSQSTGPESGERLECSRNSKEADGAAPGRFILPRARRQQNSLRERFCSARPCLAVLTGRT